MRTKTAIAGVCRVMAVASAGLALTAGQAQSATIWYVDDSAAGSNNGTSWVNAFITLQQALAVAGAGDEVRVGQGAYRPGAPGAPRTVTFSLISGVVIQGGYAGTGAANPDALEPTLFATTLSGDLNNDDGPFFANTADNVYHVVTAHNAGAQTRLAGFIITAGNASFNTDCFVGHEHSQGGGITAANAEMQVLDCVITGNRASCSGAGMFLEGGGVSFERCRIDANTMSQGATDSWGAGVTCHGEHRFSDCEFTGNRNSWYGGAVSANGGTFINCTFRDNRSWEFGAAVSGGGLRMLNCTIDANIAGNWVAGVDTGNSLIINCTFTRNSTPLCSLYFGTALRSVGGTRAINCVFAGNSGSSPTIGLTGAGNAIVNCTVVGNSIPQCAPAGIRDDGSALIANSIIWSNVDERGADEQAQLQASTATVIRNCCIEGWSGALPAQGTHGSNPRFADDDGADGIFGTEDDDLHLRANSQCIDAGDATLLPADAADIDGDGDVTEPTPLDRDFLARVVGPGLDLGAYEFQRGACRADINGDASVNIDDLLGLVGLWGACPAGQPCDGDLDLDSNVDIDDLLAVISAWGQCP